MIEDEKMMVIIAMATTGCTNVGKIKIGFDIDRKRIIILYLSNPDWG